MSRIPVRSRRQAMDWSLVLASQGIEAVIEGPTESEGWALLVPERDCGDALRILRQYRVENRGWSWQERLPWSRMRFDWVCLAWAVVLIFFHWFGAGHPGLEAAGVMDSTAVMSGQWWRIFTAMTLHADVAHLATNLSIGVVLLGLAMGRYGTGTGLLAGWLAGAAGNLASLAFNVKPFHGLGASGMVMGALGLLAAPALLPDRSNRKSLAGLAAGTMLFVLYGLAPGTDLAAHFGGFLAGILIGILLTWIHGKFFRKTATDVAYGVVFVTMVVATWAMALSHGR